MSDDLSADQRPEFGPSGYLPQRASQRARKIVLRAPLGLQWVVASLLAGVVVVVAGLLFLRTGSAPPGAPYAPVAALTELPELLVTSIGDQEVAILSAGGRTRVFAAGEDAAELRYCTDENRLVAGDTVWLPTGRGLAGAPSLDEHPSVVHDGMLYVDPSRSVPGPPPSDEPAGPLRCG